MFVKGASIAPVMVGPLITVVSVRKKSSAVSVLRFLALRAFDRLRDRARSSRRPRRGTSIATGVAFHGLYVIHMYGFRFFFGWFVATRD